MKLSLFLTLLFVVSTSQAADVNKYYFGGYQREISRSACAQIGKDMNAKLQALAKNEGLPEDTFAVTITNPFTHNNHRQLVYLCYGNFTSKNSNYGFVVNQSAERKGKTRDAQCAADRQTVESQSNFLAAETYSDEGWAWSLGCHVKSIFLVKLN